MKRILCALVLSLSIFAATFGALPAGAQTYPDKPIQLVIPVPPGVVLDLTGRMVAEELSKILKTPVLALNKPGASMVLGTDQVVRSKKDGYTLAYTNTSAIVYSRVTNPESVPYDPMKDLEPLGLHLFFPLTLTVREDAPWKSFGDLIDYAKKNPGKLRVTTPGQGTVDHFNLEIIQSITGTQFTHIPMKGEQVISSLLGGHVEVISDALSKVLPHLESGKVRVLLLTKRMPDFPSIPTITELGYKEDLFSAWAGFFAPAGIPDDVRKTLLPALKQAINHRESIDKINKMGFNVEYRSPDELRKLSIEYYERASSVAKRLGVGK